MNTNKIILYPILLLAIPTMLYAKDDFQIPQDYIKQFRIPKFSWDKIPVHVHCGIREFWDKSRNRPNTQNCKHVADNFVSITFSAALTPADTTSALAAREIWKTNPDVVVFMYWRGQRYQNRWPTLQKYHPDFVKEADAWLIKEDDSRPEYHYDFRSETMQDWISDCFQWIVTEGEGGYFGLDGVFFHPPKWWIGDHDVHSVLWAVIPQRTSERIVVAYLGGNLDLVQEHIGGTEKMRQCLFFNALYGRLQSYLICRRLDILGPYVLYGTGQKAPGSAGWIQDRFSEFWVNHVHYELGDSPRRIEFTRIASALEILEDLLVDVAKKMPVLGAVEVNIVEPVDDLPHQGAGFHVVIRISKDFTDHKAPLISTWGEFQFFEIAEQVVVDEVQ